MLCACVNVLLGTGIGRDGWMDHEVIKTEEQRKFFVMVEKETRGSERCADEHERSESMEFKESRV